MIAAEMGLEDVGANHASLLHRMIQQGMSIISGNNGVNFMFRTKKKRYYSWFKCAGQVRGSGLLWRGATSNFSTGHRRGSATPPPSIITND